LLVGPGEPGPCPVELPKAKISNDIVKLAHPWPIDIVITLVPWPTNEIEITSNNEREPTAHHLGRKLLQELPRPGVISRAVDKDEGPLDLPAAMEEVSANEEPPLPPGPYLEADISEP
jgi:hypothetical protein